MSRFFTDRLIQIANQRTFSFLNDAKILLDKIEPLILEFSHAVEEEYKIDGLLKEVKSSKSQWILRYLHYFGDQQERFVIAAPHVDKVVLLFTFLKVMRDYNIAV